MKHLGLMLFLFISFISFAQEQFSINGTIKDARNGETLLGATVYLKDSNYGTIINEYGFFSLTAPKGDYTLVISYIGYQTIMQNLRLHKDQTLNFELYESTTSLDEIIITAEESEQISIRKPQMGVSKLNSNTIKKMPAVLGEIDVVKSI